MNREKNNKMQQSDVYYRLLSRHVSGIIMPIFRRTKNVLLHMVYCIWCTALVLLDVVGSGCWTLRCRMRAVLASYNVETEVDNKHLIVSSCWFSLSSHFEVLFSIFSIQFIQFHQIHYKSKRPIGYRISCNTLHQTLYIKIQSTK